VPQSTIIRRRAGHTLKESRARDHGAFAAPKYALRALAQAMAHELDLRPWIEEW
jgi:hypothetical protein